MGTVQTNTETVKDEKPVGPLKFEQVTEEWRNSSSFKHLLDYIEQNYLFIRKPKP